MRAMRAETFSGYDALKLVELPKPTTVLRRTDRLGNETSGGPYGLNFRVVGKPSLIDKVRFVHIWELSKGCPTCNDRFRHADFRS